MLVLTRKRTEMIKIGEDIVITVVHTSRGSVKLGIQAPANVRVLRAELDNRPSTLEAADQVDLDADLNDSPVYSASQVLQRFDAEYVGDLEDQTLLCLAK